LCPVATVAEVEALADAVAARYRAMILLAASCSLRFGNLLPCHGDVSIPSTV
jgi:hypothetical protein